MPITTAVVKPGIVALDATTGLTQTIAAFDGTCARFGVTNRRLSEVEVANLDSLYGARTPGKLRPSHVTNAKAWVRVVDAATNDFDVHFDWTAKPATMEDVGFKQPWGESLGGNEVGPAFNVQSYYAITAEERHSIGLQFGASDVFKRRGVTLKAIETPDPDGNPAYAFDNTPWGVFRVSVSPQLGWINPAACAGQLMGFAGEDAGAAHSLGYTWGLYESGISGGNVRYSCRNYSTWTVRAKYQEARATLTALFGVTPNVVFGDAYTARQQYGAGPWVDGWEWYTHPGGVGWVPATGLYFHGVHPYIRGLTVRGGVVTRVLVEASGEAIADYVAGQEPYVDEGNRESIRLTAAQLRTGLAGKWLRVVTFDEPVGPFDVYDCYQIQKAFDDGAETSDIDDTRVSGKKCSIWRKENLSRAKARVISYVLKKGSAAGDIVNVKVDFTRGVGGAPSAFIVGPSPTTTIDSVVLWERSITAVGGQAVVILSDDEAEQAVRALFTTAREVLPADSSQPLTGMYEAESTDLGDMPYVWWQSAGLAGFEGVMKSLVLSTLVPGTRSVT